MACRVLLLWRWIYTKGRTLWKIQSTLPSILKLSLPWIISNLKRDANGQGMGRHSEAEVIEIGINDLRAISTYLGSFTLQNVFFPWF